MFRGQDGRRAEQCERCERPPRPLADVAAVDVTGDPGILDSLPAPSRAALLQAIDQVNRELGTTTALITHNRSIEGMADRVLRFADGRIAEVAENASRCPPERLAW